MSFAEVMHINRQHSKPIYRQISEQIRIQIGDGRLPAGTQLPPVRQLAEMLGITRVTAQNAYSELQAGGWVESTVGRGTFVIGAPQTHELVSAIGEQTSAGDIISNRARISQIAGVRSFAFAEPDPAFFPLDDFRYALNAQSESLADLMQYGTPQGDPLLRVEVAAMLTERGINCAPDELLITLGVSQGVSLVTLCLAGPGTCVALDQPVYLGLLHLLGTTNVQPIGITWDNEGPDLNRLEQVICEQQPRFFYTSANFQNPTGRCMSPQRKLDLLELANKYHLYIVEDDTYGQLAYEDSNAVPLKALDRAGRVIYLSGFSKTLMPGLRTGYVLAPGELRQRLIMLRQALDLSGVTLVQRALASFLHRGRFKAHLRRVLPRYRERRDALLTALQVAMPARATWTKPAGGLCVWVTLPPGQYSDLYHTALRNGVAFTPGDVFLTESDGEMHMRLCFGKHSPEEIREGIATLGQLIRGQRPASGLRGESYAWPLV